MQAHQHSLRSIPPPETNQAQETTLQETTLADLAKMATYGRPSGAARVPLVRSALARYAPSPPPLPPGVIQEGIAGVAAGAAAGAAAAAFGFALRAAFFFFAAFGAAAFGAAAFFFFLAATAFLTFFTFFAFALDFFAFFAMLDLPIVWPMVQRSCRHWSERSLQRRRHSAPRRPIDQLDRVDNRDHRPCRDLPHASDIAGGDHVGLYLLDIPDFSRAQHFRNIRMKNVVGSGRAAAQMALRHLSHLEAQSRQQCLR